MERNTKEFFAALDVLAEQDPTLIVKDDNVYNSPELCELVDYGDYMSAFDSFGFYAWKEDIEKVEDEVLKYIDARRQWGSMGDDMAEQRFHYLKREDLNFWADIFDNHSLYRNEERSLYRKEHNTDGVVVTEDLLNEARLIVKQDCSRAKILANRILENIEQRQGFENAVKADDLAKVEEMLSQSAIVSNIYEEETLQFADSPEMIKLLVEHGARIVTDNGASSDLDFEYRSLFVDAIKEGRPDKAAAYIQCGADVSFEAADWGKQEGVNEALWSLKESNKEAFNIINQMVEDVRNGKSCKEVRLEDYQNVSAPEQKETEKQTVQEKSDAKPALLRTEKGRLLFSPEFDTRTDVIKVALAQGLNMYFVPSTGEGEQGVYEFCSKNETEAEKKVQTWCEGVKNPKLTKDLLFHAARDAVLVGLLEADPKQKKTIMKNPNKPLKSMMQLKGRYADLFRDKTAKQLEDVAKGSALDTEAKETSVSVTKEEKQFGTPLPIIADDKGMVHLAPRENLRQSAIISMSLFDEKGAEIAIKAALVSDKMPLQSNAKLSQEDMVADKGKIEDSVFLIPYSKAKDVVSKMEEHGASTASIARVHINLFKNMGEKSPVEKSYDNKVVAAAVRGGINR